MFEKTFEIVWSPTVVLCSDSFSPIPFTSSAMKTPENRRGPRWFWTSSWRRYPNGMLLWLVVCRQSIGAATKNYLQELGSM